MYGFLGNGNRLCLWFLRRCMFCFAFVIQTVSAKYVDETQVSKKDVVPSRFSLTVKSRWCKMFRAEAILSACPT